MGNFRSGHHVYAHFLDGVTKAQRRKTFSLRPHCGKEAGLRVTPWSRDSGGQRGSELGLGVGGPLLLEAFKEFLLQVSPALGAGDRTTEEAERNQIMS